MRRGTHSWVLLGSGRRQSWRKITKSLCVMLRKFEFYLPCHWGPLRTTEGHWHDQMMNKSFKEYFGGQRGMVNWNMALARKIRLWQDGKVQVCVFFSFFRESIYTTFPYLSPTVQLRMWLGPTRTHRLCLGSLRLYRLYSDLRSVDLIHMIGDFKLELVTKRDWL